jgi:hypothetical protein
MQVSATLIAAQQAAREARARMALPQAQATPQANFASALEDLTGTSAPQAAAKPAAAAPSPMPQAQAPGRLGQHVNILV